MACDDLDIVTRTLKTVLQLLRLLPGSAVGFVTVHLPDTPTLVPSAGYLSLLLDCFPDCLLCRLPRYATTRAIRQITRTPLSLISNLRIYDHLPERFVRYPFSFSGGVIRRQPCSCHQLLNISTARLRPSKGRHSRHDIQSTNNSRSRLYAFSTRALPVPLVTGLQSIDTPYG